MVENRIPMVLVRTATPGGMPSASSTGRVSRDPEPTAALMAPARVPMTSRTISERGSTSADPTEGRWCGGQRTERWPGPGGAARLPRQEWRCHPFQVEQSGFQNLGVVVLGVFRRVQEHEVRGVRRERTIAQRLGRAGALELAAVVL